MLDQFNPSVAFVKQKRHEFKVFYVHIINISLINDSNRTEEKNINQRNMSIYSIQNVQVIN